MARCEQFDQGMEKVGHLRVVFATLAVGCVARFSRAQLWSAKAVPWVAGNYALHPEAFAATCRIVSGESVTAIIEPVHLVWPVLEESRPTRPFGSRGPLAAAYHVSSPLHESLPRRVLDTGHRTGGSAGEA